MDDRQDDGTDVEDELQGDTNGLTTLLGHFYRGEMDRVTAERSRLDQTTNWAVTIMAAVLTWAFSSPDNPHYILLIGMVTLVVFHYVETRRYRAFDVWRSRIRLLEEDLFATTIDPEGPVSHEDWRQELGADLRRPALKTPFAEAYARRLRRIYLPLLLVLVAAWVARVTIFVPGESALTTAAVVGIPGPVVILAVAAFLGAALAVALWPRERQAMGEFYERQKEGDWKEEKSDRLEDHRRNG